MKKENKNKVDKCEVINCLIASDVVEQFTFSPFGTRCAFFVPVCKDHCVQIHDLEYSKHLPEDILYCCYNDCHKLVNDPKEFSCLKWETLLIARELPVSGTSFFCDIHTDDFKQQTDNHKAMVDE